MEQRKLEEMQDPSKKFGKGLPIEDSELLNLAQDLKRPLPSYDFGDIHDKIVPKFMTVWNFLSIFRYIF